MGIWPDQSVLVRKKQAGTWTVPHWKKTKECHKRLFFAPYWPWTKSDWPVLKVIDRVRPVTFKVCVCPNIVCCLFFQWTMQMIKWWSWHTQFINPTRDIHSRLAKLNHQQIPTIQPVWSHCNISLLIYLATTTEATYLSQKYTVIATTNRFLEAGTQLNRTVRSELPTQLIQDL